MADKAVCAEGYDGDTILPLFGDAEQRWPNGLRIFLYLLALFYMFMGVAIIADVFMGAIEKVTSKKKQITDKSTGKKYTYEVWNATVANLTLMALGSSAPEILLNVIDIFKQGFHSGKLGPSTIVGSAAFNMLMIISVCVSVIPQGEIRRIKETAVYAITASWSILAYLWLLVILIAITPNVVDVWEGVVTFLFFPILCCLAFAADKGYFSCFEPPPGEDNLQVFTVHEDMTTEQLAEAEMRIRADHGGGLSEEQVARLLAAMYPPPKTRAFYRIEATRRMFGGKKVKLLGMKSLHRTISEQMSFLGGGPGTSKKSKVVPFDEQCEQSPKAPRGGDQTAACYFEFKHSRTVVMENVGQVQVEVSRRGDTSFAASVDYSTKDGEATGGQDYEARSGTLDFAPGQTEISFTVKIIDDAAYETDEEFYVEISNPKVLGDAPAQTAALGGKPRLAIVIIDDDDPGVIAFQEENMVVKQNANGDDKKVEIIVKRKKGATGKVAVTCKTESDSALPGRDYEEIEEMELEFGDMQAEASVWVNVKHQARYGNTDKFRVILTDPTGGARIDGSTDGGEEKNILTVSIEADDVAKERIDKIRGHLQVKWDKSKVGHKNWALQFKAALYVNGGEDDDDEDDAPGLQEIIFHWISVPWKLAFALVPPVDYCDGWLCLIVSLLGIGLVTLFIGELASLLGCCMCISDDITAITFVALGTSMPDTFASRTAAVQDPFADASVGNVTGSNSVNVFLGLGLPWMMAAIYWAVIGKDSAWEDKYQLMTPQSQPGGLDLSSLGPPGPGRRQGFVVEAGSLTFSVTVFSCCAVVCIAVLALRRQFLGGELGGPSVPKILTSLFLASLWVAYIGMSVWKSLEAAAESGGGGCQF